MKLNIAKASDLKTRVIERCDQLDMQEMAKDVAPFLFNPSDVKKILHFPDYLKQVTLR